MMNSRSTIWLLLVVLAGSPVLAADADSFVLEGDLSAFYASGNFVLWKPKQAAQGKPAVRMSLSAASTADKPAATEPPYDTIMSAPLRPDGTFSVEGTVDTPHRVYFYVLDAIGHEGQRFAPMKGNALILEPGRTAPAHDPARAVSH